MCYAVSTSDEVCIYIVCIHNILVVRDHCSSCYIVVIYVSGNLSDCEKELIVHFESGKTEIMNINNTL